MAKTPKLLRRDLILFNIGSSYRKRTASLWELDEQPAREEVVMYYEDIRPKRLVTN